MHSKDMTHDMNMKKSLDASIARVWEYINYVEISLRILNMSFE